MRTGAFRMPGGDWGAAFGFLGHSGLSDRMAELRQAPCVPTWVQKAEQGPTRGSLGALSSNQSHEGME